VIALGGSIMYPDTIDTNFLKQFRAFIVKRVKTHRFVIVAGGGRIARVYVEAAAKILKPALEDQYWLGIRATHANGQLLRTLFPGLTDPVLIDKRGKIKKLAYPITIGAGWEPGKSTDHSAVALAADFGVSEAIIAGSPAYVYDKDPKKFKNAKPLRKLSWKEYKHVAPNVWKPGLHSPVDPVAAKVAEQNKIKAIIVNGKNLKNFGNLLDGKEFSGTIIE
jgi:uridylate kinase